ncbi:hypothetical protein [Paraglaciecola sp.]|uniref:hypothetical protein n=1 Tax=Paraglaciecola sp. TaxID=1920173 RepID=UPI003262DAA2
MKKAFIHIGPHKTASTYIQKQLFDNKDSLKQAGFIYPDEGINIQWGHHQLAEFAKNEKEKELEKTIGSINREYNLVLSSENFDRLNSKQILLLKRVLNDYEIHIIYVKRRCDDLLVSTWQEEIKHGSSIPWENFFLNHVTRPFISEILNHTIILDRFSEVFGKENISIIDYDKCKADNVSIFTTFCNLLNLPLKTFIHSSDKINISINYSHIEIIRYLNELASDLGNKNSADIRDSFLKYVKSNSDCEDLQYLSKKINKRKVSFQIDNSYIFSSSNNIFNEKYAGSVCNNQNEFVYKPKSYLLPAYNSLTSSADISRLERLLHKINIKG